MSTLTESTVIQSIRIIPAVGEIHVERVTQVLRDGEVIATGTPTAEKLTQDQDLSAMGLEPLVLAVVAAAWTPDQVEAATTAAFAKMAAVHVEEQAAHASRLEGLERSRAAVAAAHAELDAEHATLAERSAKITADRADLFAQGEAISAQRATLAADRPA